MLKKFIFLTFCLIANHLTASENDFAEKISPNIDRYQMQVVMDKDGINTKIYLLDKEKGIIWMTENSLWTFEYSDWVKLPPLPM